MDRKDGQTDQINHNWHDRSEARFGRAMSLALTLSMAGYRTLRALPLRLGRSFCGLQVFLVGLPLLVVEFPLAFAFCAPGVKEETLIRTKDRVDSIH